ncbi:protein kinase [Solirubrobacter phytolaccae]|uniref:non-specific serine/threonine protein kinase n=1 Tax=Solirubrobacter phytolaccae TaxID=1404360 RepID=A0A9X3N5G5_9ACTN|nr:protein kinase [Solirubrobacter phytolaccae]MDA0178815.1 protein kinase [Solirubrobacter phytolaccae]
MQLGRYVLDPNRMKEGGQAFVYFTTDPYDGARVAIKVSRPSTWSHQRMVREIQAQKALDHPNILPVRDHDTDLGWYATDEAECSLDDLGPFPRAQWMYLRAGMTGVVSAIAYAHAQGYVHRDLSPGNILVFGGGWTVSDWGFVYLPPRKAPRMTEPLERFGTPEFMAPEQVADPRKVGPEADIFALGRIAAWATMLNRDEGSSDDHPFTAWWRRLIDGTTAYDPAKRWAIRDLQAHLRTKPSVQRLQEPEFDQPLTVSRADSCPQCGSARGRDAAERCLHCHTHLAY